jgi:hypothetical protein
VTGVALGLGPIPALIITELGPPPPPPARDSDPQAGAALGSQKIRSIVNPYGKSFLGPKNVLGGSESRALVPPRIRGVGCAVVGVAAGLVGMG